jgi:putative DNA primase/helicase
VIVRHLMPLASPTGLFIGNANIRPLNPKRYLYHAYLSFMESRGHQHPMSLTAFGQAIPQTLKEYEVELLKRKTRNGIQTSLELSEDCESDWLPRCDG